jgi:hypothetical protein
MLLDVHLQAPRELASHTHLAYPWQSLEPFARARQIDGEEIAAHPFTHYRLQLFI